MYDIKESGSLTCKGFIGHVRPLQPPAIFEIPLVDGSFMTHHSLDMNYIFTDKRFPVFFFFYVQLIIDFVTHYQGLITNSLI